MCVTEVSPVAKLPLSRRREILRRLLTNAYDADMGEYSSVKTDMKKFQQCCNVVSALCSASPETVSFFSRLDVFDILEGFSLKEYLYGDFMSVLRSTCPAYAEYLHERVTRKGDDPTFCVFPGSSLCSDTANLEAFIDMHDVAFLFYEVVALLETSTDDEYISVDWDANVDTTCLSDVDCVIFDVICQCSSGSSLRTLLGNSSFLEETDNHHFILVVNSLLNHHPCSIPPSVYGTPLTNMYIMRSGQLSNVKALVQRGHSIVLPMTVAEQYNLGFDDVDVEVLEYILKRYNVYPFEGDINDMCGKYVDDHGEDTDIIATLLVVGQFIPRSKFFSVFLKKVSFNLCRDLHVKLYELLRKWLREHVVTFDISAWTSSPVDGPEDCVVQLLVDSLTELEIRRLVKFLFTHKKCNMYVSLNFWSVELYKKNLFSNVDERTLTFARSTHTHHVDPRVVNYVFRRPTSKSTGVTERALPDFTVPPGEVLEIVDDSGLVVSVPVYFSYVLARSDFVKALVKKRERCFKRYRCDTSVVRLECGLPDTVGNKQRVIKNYIGHCYTSLFGSDLSVDDVLDLRSLGAYFLDDEMLKCTEEWMHNQYLENHREHMGHYTDCLNTCSVCMFWAKGCATSVGLPLNV